MWVKVHHDQNTLKKNLCMGYVSFTLCTSRHNLCLRQLFISRCHTRMTPANYHWISFYTFHDVYLCVGLDIQYSDEYFYLFSWCVSCIYVSLKNATLLKEKFLSPRMVLVIKLFSFNDSPCALLYTTCIVIKSFLKVNKKMDPYPITVFFTFWAAFCKRKKKPC